MTTAIKHFNNSHRIIAASPTASVASPGKLKCGDHEYFSLSDVTALSQVDIFPRFSGTCCLPRCVEDGGSRLLQTGGAYLNKYMATHHGKQLSAKLHFHKIYAHSDSTAAHNLESVVQ